MPFIAMFSDGTYFRKVGRAKRSRVEDLQLATTWANKGHLKLALIECFRLQGRYSDWPKDFQIIQVKLAKFGKRENLSIKKNLPDSYSARVIAREPVTCTCMSGCKSATCDKL